MEDNMPPAQGQAPVASESTPTPPSGGVAGAVPPPAGLQTSVPPVSEPQKQEVPLVDGVKPKKGGGALLWIGVGILIIALIGAGAYFVWTKNKSSVGSPTPTPTVTVSPTTTPTGQETYSDKNGMYSFKYPSEAEVKEQSDGTVTVSIWGPTQKEDTEFYDGLSLSFKTNSLSGKNLMTITQEKAVEFKDLFETSTPSAVTMASASGYSFHVKGMVEADYYYLPLDATSYLEIVNSTKDPTGKGFVIMAQDILSSLILQPTLTPSASITP